MSHLDWDQYSWASTIQFSDKGSESDLDFTFVESTDPTSQLSFSKSITNLLERDQIPPSVALGHTDDLSIATDIKQILNEVDLDLHQEPNGPDDSQVFTSEEGDEIYKINPFVAAIPVVFTKAAWFQHAYTGRLDHVVQADRIDDDHRAVAFMRGKRERME